MDTGNKLAIYTSWRNFLRLTLLLLFIWALRHVGFYYDLFSYTFYDVVGYDKILHTLGGVALGMFAINLRELLLLITNKTHLPVSMLSAAILMTIFGGVIWEIAEFAYPPLRGNNAPLLLALYVKVYWFDTVLDLIYDLLGGYIAVKWHKKT